jgi:hypothetical protein
MTKTAVTLILISLTYILSFTTASHAQTCPDYYRFVDFGLEDNNGRMYRGGTLLRAEGFSAEALLLENLTQCIEVRDLAKDGHGNPIPVVKSINYIPEITGTDLNALRVSREKDTEAAANQNAKMHLANIQNTENITTKGENFVCVKPKTADMMSCQLVSPYAGNISLVVYCNATTCEMPVLAINKELMITASWKSSAAMLEDPLGVGSQSVAKAQQIHDFLKPLSATLQ